MFGQTAVSLFPVQNYNFGEKAAQPAKDTSVEARIQRIRQQCAPGCPSASGLFDATIDRRPTAEPARVVRVTKKTARWTFSHPALAYSCCSGVVGITGLVRPQYSGNQQL